MMWLWKNVDFPAEHKGKRKGDEMLVRRDPTDDPISLTCRKTHSDDHFCPAGRQRGGRRVKQPGVRIELPLEGEDTETSSCNLRL